jgi:hypothetical protein
VPELPSASLSRAINLIGGSIAIEMIAHPTGLAVNRLWLTYQEQIVAIQRKQ